MTTTLRDTSGALIASRREPLWQFAHSLSQLARVTIEHTSQSTRLVPAGAGEAAIPLVDRGQVVATGCEWLRQRLASHGPHVSLRPRSAPRGVHEVTQALFGAYAIDGGAVHLAGCELVDRVFVRVTSDPLATGIEPEVEHALYTSTGQAVSPELADLLGLWDCELLAHLPARVTPEQFAQLAEAFPPHGEQVAPPLAMALVWAKWIEGRLEIQIGPATRQLAFSGWAPELHAPSLDAALGAEGFHVAATDDGEILPAVQIATCEVSGRRLATSKLVRCAATGQRVDAHLTHPCPVSGEPTLREQFRNCAVCGQLVGRGSMTGATCHACGELAPIAASHAVVSNLLRRYATLRKFGAWRHCATAEVDLLECRGWWRRLHLAVDRDTGEVRGLSTGSRLAKGWHRVPPSDWSHVLGG